MSVSSQFGSRDSGHETVYLSQILFKYSHYVNKRIMDSVNSLSFVTIFPF